MSARRKFLVVVLGMHRSGTSAITRALEALGIELGDELMPAAPDNVKGFFEDQEVNSLNIELLKSLGRDWHTLSPLSSRELTAVSLKPLEQRALRIVRSKLRGHLNFAIKDPRLPRLLPFWNRVLEKLDVDVRYVIAIRNPISVAQSLHTRDQFLPEKSYFLWLEHVVPSILDTRGHKRLVVEYDRLLDKPQHEFERIADALHLRGAIRAESLREFQDEFLDARLRHSRCLLKDLERDTGVPREVKEAYRLLTKAASDRVSLDAPSLQKQFEQFRSFLDSAAPVLRCIDKQDDVLDPLQRVLTERDGEIASLRAALAHSRDEFGALEKAVGAYKDQLAVREDELSTARAAHAHTQAEFEAKCHHVDLLTGNIAELTTSLSAAAAALKTREQEIAASRETLEQLKGEFQAKCQALETLGGENRGLQEQLASVRAQVASMESQALEAQQAIDQLRDETSTLRLVLEHTAQGVDGVADTLEAAVERRTPRSRH